MFGSLNSRTTKIVAAAVLTASATLVIGAPSASAQPKTTVLDTVTLSSLQGVCAGHGGEYHHGVTGGEAWGACLLPGGQVIYCNPVACVFVSPGITSGTSAYKAPAPVGNSPATALR